MVIGLYTGRASCRGSYTSDHSTVFTVDTLITRPIFVILVLVTTGVFAWDVIYSSRKGRLDYA